MVVSSVGWRPFASVERLMAVGFDECRELLIVEIEGERGLGGVQTQRADVLFVATRTFCPFASAKNAIESRNAEALVVGRA